MEVRRPLQPVPLACFLPLSQSPPPRTTSHRYSLKRSRSPSAMLSPAKRRILRQEGYLASPSSGAKTNANRETSLKRDDSPRGRLRPRLASVTNDESMQGVGDKPPFIDAVAARTRSRVSSTSRIVAPNVHTTPSKQLYNDPSLDLDCPTSHQRVVPPLMVPREMPPRPDPQSPHYPGFDIYYDTHIEIPSTSSRYRPDLDLDLDEEDLKENTPLKRLAKKFAGVSFGIDTGHPRMAGSDKPKIPSKLSTPFRKTPFPDPATLLAERSSHCKATTSHGFTPGRSPDSAVGKLARRQALMDELDDACSDDEGL